MKIKQDKKIFAFPKLEKFKPDFNSSTHIVIYLIVAAIIYFLFLAYGVSFFSIISFMIVYSLFEYIFDESLHTSKSEILKPVFINIFVFTLSSIIFFSAAIISKNVETKLIPVRKIDVTEFTKTGNYEYSIPLKTNNNITIKTINAKEFLKLKHCTPYLFNKVSLVTYSLTDDLDKKTEKIVIDCK